MIAGGERRPRVRRSTAWLLLAWALIATVGLLARHLTEGRFEIPAEWRTERLELPARPADRLVLERAGYGDLRGWSEDDVAAALPALRRSCLHYRFRGPGAEIRPSSVGGTVADWLPACAALEELLVDGSAGAVSAGAARAFFEESFAALRVRNGPFRRGLFTGYYEPLLHGSRRRHGRYQVPLHQLPGDIVSVDLGEFGEEWRGRRLAGRLAGSRLVPYPSREEIVAGALARRNLELLWVDDPVDAFFLQIQGSGRVQMDDGSVLRLGYAGQNGHPYFAIGRELIDRGALTAETVSMQSIRAWLEAHPDEAAGVMAMNRSYVFFRELGRNVEGPLGSQGVALTPGRSLAVDRAFLPMGAPVWLDATAPAADPDAPDLTLRRLLIAQDTGGAIRGPVRGDVFWGAGGEAAEIAGRMKHEGELWILLPRALADRALGAHGER